MTVTLINCVTCEYQMRNPDSHEQFNAICPRCLTNNKRWFEINSPAEQTWSKWIPDRYPMAINAAMGSVPFGLIGMLVTLNGGAPWMIVFGLFLFGILISIAPLIVLRDRWREIYREQVWEYTNKPQKSEVYQFVGLSAFIILMVGVCIPAMLVAFIKMPAYFPSVTKLITGESGGGNSPVVMDLTGWFYVITLLSAVTVWATYTDLRRYVSSIRRQLPRTIINDMSKRMRVIRFEIERVFQFTPEELQSYRLKILQTLPDGALELHLSFPPNNYVTSTGNVYLVNPNQTTQTRLAYQIVVNFRGEIVSTSVVQGNNLYRFRRSP